MNYITKTELCGKLFSTVWQEQKMYMEKLKDAKDLKAPIFAISRLRMGTDGGGVTTLVTFMGCPLKCRYCINPQCHKPVYQSDGVTPAKGVMMLTPQELYDMVKRDDIYFQATGGGICFGGGEPRLYHEFIVEFKKLCAGRGKITLESCLRCPDNAIEHLASVVDHWIVDVKSLDAAVYMEYTGCATDELRSLLFLRQLVPQERVKVKIPQIPGYNDDRDLESDVMRIKELGFDNVTPIQYIIK